MNAKDTLVEALREEGWDFISASVHAQRFLDEFKASSERKRMFHSQTRSFVLRKVGPVLTRDDEQKGDQA